MGKNQKVTIGESFRVVFASLLLLGAIAIGWRVIPLTLSFLSRQVSPSPEDLSPITIPIHNFGEDLVGVTFRGRNTQQIEGSYHKPLNQEISGENFSTLLHQAQKPTEVIVNYGANIYRSVMVDYVINQTSFSSFYYHENRDVGNGLFTNRMIERVEYNQRTNMLQVSFKGIDLIGGLILSMLISIGLVGEIIVAGWILLVGLREYYRLIISPIL